MTPAAKRAPFIVTRGGRRWDILHPDPHLVNIEDIAHSLSMQCRFTGHTSRHYSVGEHSIRVAELLRSWGYPPSVVKWGLLHDGEETYNPDLNSPTKQLAEMRFYRELGSTTQRAICSRFDMEPVEPAIVRKADLVMLATEARDLMPCPQHWEDLPYPPAFGRIPAADISPAHVRDVFLHTFHRLQEAA